MLMSACAGEKAKFLFLSKKFLALVRAYFSGLSLAFKGQFSSIFCTRKSLMRLLAIQQDTQKMYGQLLLDVKQNLLHNVFHSQDSPIQKCQIFELQSS